MTRVYNIRWVDPLESRYSHGTPTQMLISDEISKIFLKLTDIILNWYFI
ncbi:hypothetical protein HanXRQr2_Chr03g0120141 [Helianthus annuus]|uniref:Uncharacterized protein n=1 Tax=Helianthus annuus TaxID=4232 RepID=A0A9K3JHC0_HELAN|nr:hypothetical protein HanXRQr2_Chr03g0120141 [Helianthus annuus]KAJ0944431.1 hypothetical protein HanPSC8_Chr03g0116661 [Helianthus annuus]